jgi:SAM-dependent methyltransferase
MIKKILDLGLQPLANNYLQTNSKLNKTNIDTYKLEIVFNTVNSLVSIKKKIPKEKMFNNKYPYKSSLSSTMRTSFKKISQKIKNKFKPRRLLEIGSNDGPFITNFDKNKVIGVEPCGNLAKITKRYGYYTYANYWNTKLSKIIKKKFKDIDVIYSANTITHIENLNNVFKAISNVLCKNGILVIEDPSLLECLKKNSYDQFYNEHIYIFSALSLQKIIQKFGFEIFDIEKLPTHGGSLRYFIKRVLNKKLKIKKNVSNQIKFEITNGLENFTRYKKFAHDVYKSREMLVSLLKKLKKKNKKIIGYGATAKATTVLNYCKIGDDMIDYFLDTTPDKVGRYMPGTNIRILKYNKKFMKKNYFVFLGAWNFKKEIFIKESNFLKKGGKFISHIPFPRII